MVDNFTELRRAMVDSQVRTTDVTQWSLIEAMLTVPRHLFVPASRRDFAYIDDDVKVSDEPARYVIEPSPFARLVQLAEVTNNDLVLDIGCTTGYSSAVFSRIAGAVIAVEENEALATLATETLAEHGYDNVAVVTAPLTEGYAGEGPYDVIFVGGSVDFVPDALIAQIKPGGRLVVARGVGLTGYAEIHVRDSDGVVSSRRAFNVSTKPLPGFEKLAEFQF